MEGSLHVSYPPGVDSWDVSLQAPVIKQETSDLTAYTADRSNGYRRTPLFDWISDLNNSDLKINVNAEEKEDLVSKTPVVRLEKLEMQSDVCHQSRLCDKPLDSVTVKTEGAGKSGCERNKTFQELFAEYSELETGLGDTDRADRLSDSVSQSREDATRSRNLEPGPRHRGASSDPNPGKNAARSPASVSKNDFSASLCLRRADGEWRVSKKPDSCQDATDTNSELDLEISNVVSLSSEYCVRFESLNDDYNVAVLDYSFQTQQTPEPSSWQLHAGEKTVRAESALLADDQNRILRRRVAGTEYEFETLSEPGHGLYLVEEPDPDDQKLETRSLESKTGIRKEFFTRSKIRRAGTYRRRKLTSPWKLARTEDRPGRNADTDSDSIEADDLPEIHPPKRRRQYRARPVHPVLVTAAANNELNRLSREFPKHNWLEQKIRLTQNDMSTPVDSKTEDHGVEPGSVVKPDDLVADDLDAATDIENNNDLTDDQNHNAEEESQENLKVKDSDTDLEKTVGLEADLVIDEQCSEDTRAEISEEEIKNTDQYLADVKSTDEYLTDIKSERYNSDISTTDQYLRHDEDGAIDDVADSRLVIAESEDSVCRPEGMDVGQQLDSNAPSDEGDMKKSSSDSGDDKANLHQGFWSTNPPVARKKTPVQRVQPQMKSSDASPASASQPGTCPSASQPGTCPSSSQTGEPRSCATDAPEAQSPAEPEPEVATTSAGCSSGPATKEDQITIRRFMEEIQDTIERNVESVTMSSGSECQSSIPALKPLVHPPIPNMSVVGVTDRQDGLGSIPKLISVYEESPQTASMPPAQASREHERGVLIDSTNAVMAMTAIDAPAQPQAPGNSEVSETSEEQARKRPADTPAEFPDASKVPRTDCEPQHNDTGSEEPRVLDENQQKELSRLRAEFQHVEALIAIKEREKQSLMVTRSKLGVLIAKIGLRMNVNEESPVPAPRSARTPEDGSSPPLKRPESAQSFSNGIIAHRTRSTVPRHLLYPDKFTKKDILHSSEMKHRCQEGLAKKIAEQERCNLAASSRSRGQPSPWKRYSQAQMTRGDATEAENALNLSSHTNQPPEKEVVDLTNEKGMVDCGSAQDLQLTATGLVLKKEAAGEEEKPASGHVPVNAHIIPALQAPTQRPKSGSQLIKDPHTYAILGALGFTDIRTEGTRASPIVTVSTSKPVAQTHTPVSSSALPAPLVTSGRPQGPQGPPGLQAMGAPAPPSAQATSQAHTINHRQVPGPPQRSPNQPVFPGPPPRLEQRRTPPGDQPTPMSHDQFVRMAAQQAMQRSSRPSPHGPGGQVQTMPPQRAPTSHNGSVIRHTAPQAHPGYMYPQTPRHAYPQSANHAHHQARRDATPSSLQQHKPQQHSPPGLHSPQQQSMVRPGLVQYPGMVPPQYQHQLIMEQQLREQQMRNTAPSARSQHALRQQAPQFMMPGPMEARHPVPQTDMPMYMERILGQLPPGHEGLAVHPAMSLNHESAQIHHNQVRQMEAARHPPQVMNHGQYQSRASSQHENQQARSNGSGMHGQSERYCFACHSVASYLCSGCKKVWFCSADCQMKGWIAHSKDCMRASKEEG